MENEVAGVGRPASFLVRAAHLAECEDERAGDGRVNKASVTGFDDELEEEGAE